MPKHEVKFVAKKKVSVPARVEFHTKDGKEVEFNAHKKVKKPVEVDFMAGK